MAGSIEWALIPSLKLMRNSDIGVATGSLESLLNRSDSWSLMGKYPLPAGKRNKSQKDWTLRNDSLFHKVDWGVLS